MYLDGYEVIEKYEAKWLKIFYHNSKNNVYFNYSIKEAYLTTSHPDKYSIMKYIPRINRYEEEKYEFFLEYPGKEGFNRWSQRINPLQITKHPYTGDIGFEEINLTWRGYVFSGLSQVNSVDSQFSCSVNRSLFHYSIGAYKQWGNKTFAGPRLDDENQNPVYSFTVDEAKLWMRIAGFTNLFKKYCTFRPNMRKMSTHIFMITLIIKS